MKPNDQEFTSSIAAPDSRRRKFYLCIRRNYFMLLTIFCIIIGVVIGFLLNHFSVAEIASVYIGLPGELFMRALNFCVIPLLACNIISMSAKLKPASHGKAALLAFTYCIVLNIVAAFFGLGFTIIIAPGSRFDVLKENVKVFRGSGKKIDLVDVFPDFLRNMVPDNILKTLLFSTVTTYVTVEASNESQEAGGSDNSTEGAKATGSASLQRTLDSTSGPNILGILVSSLVLGLIAGSRAEKTKAFIALAEAVTEVMSVLIEKVIKLLPLAMVSLIAAAVAKMDRLDQSVLTLLLFVATSATFHAIFVIILLPSLFAIIVRRNLFLIYPRFFSPIVTAFTMTSSLIALPDIFRACDSIGVDPQLVRTIAPFLTSFNANGSAAFIASSVCFIAQLARYNLSVVQYVAIGFLSGVNVMALPAVPSTSLITVFLIVKVFNIPETFISLLFVSEFIADRLRTMVNVISHATCIMFVHYKTAGVKGAVADEKEAADSFWLKGNNSTVVELLNCEQQTQVGNEDTALGTEDSHVSVRSLSPNGDCVR